MNTVVKEKKRFIQEMIIKGTMNNLEWKRKCEGKWIMSQILQVQNSGPASIIRIFLRFENQKRLFDCLS